MTSTDLYGIPLPAEAIRILGWVVAFAIAVKLLSAIADDKLVQKSIPWARTLASGIYGYLQRINHYPDQPRWMTVTALGLRIFLSYFLMAAVLFYAFVLMAVFADAGFAGRPLSTQIIATVGAYFFVMCFMARQLMIDGTQGREELREFRGGKSSNQKKL